MASEVVRDRLESFGDDEQRLRVATAIADAALWAGDFTQRFRDVKRVPRYADNEPETDVEHSYMLAMAVPEIASQLNLELDIDKVRCFALIHDAIEIKTGDVATFNLTPE